MQRLYSDLMEANRRTNLTRITSEDDFWNLHVLDSLAVGLALPEVLRASLRLADVGCGAGFPLLPLAWANPLLDITGIEARGKKVEFLQAEIAALGLANAHVHQAQAREAGRTDGLGRQFDVVLLRAVGPAGKLLRACRHLLKDTIGAKIVFYKTPDAVETERPLAQREAEKFGLTFLETPPFALPGRSGQRQFLIFATG